MARLQADRFGSRTENWTRKQQSNKTELRRIVMARDSGFPEVSQEGKHPSIATTFYQQCPGRIVMWL